MAVNLSGAFHTMRRALPEMAKRGYGRVINIVSVHGLVASVNNAPYVPAKFGLVGLSRVAALEYAATGSQEAGGVTVNCICPGWTRPRLSNRRSRREPPRSPETATLRLPACSQRSSRAGERPDRRRSDHRRCGSRIPRRITSQVLQSRLMVVKRRNNYVNCCCLATACSPALIPSPGS